jgi:hypothetical protein
MAFSENASPASTPPAPPAGSGSEVMTYAVVYARTSPARPTRTSKARSAAYSVNTSPAQ